MFGGLRKEDKRCYQNDWNNWTRVPVIWKENLHEDLQREGTYTHDKSDDTDDEVGTSTAKAQKPREPGDHPMGRSQRRTGT